MEFDLLQLKLQLHTVLLEEDAQLLRVIYNRSKCNILEKFYSRAASASQHLAPPASSNAESEALEEDSEEMEPFDTEETAEERDNKAWIAHENECGVLMWRNQEIIVSFVEGMLDRLRTEKEFSRQIRCRQSLFQTD